MQSAKCFSQDQNIIHQRWKIRLCWALLVLALVFTVMATTLRWQGALGWLVSDMLWWVTASILLALWAVHDHGDRGAGELDWDQMLFVFWPLTLLLWLVRTRGARGLVGYAAAWALVCLPSIVPWLVF